MEIKKEKLKLNKEVNYKEDGRKIIYYNFTDGKEVIADKGEEKEEK